MKAKKNKQTKKKFIIFSGNRRLVKASREAIGAMKYKSEYSGLVCQHTF